MSKPININNKREQQQGYDLLRGLCVAFEGLKGSGKTTHCTSFLIHRVRTCFMVSPECISKHKTCHIKHL
ncbi:hypothetical protein AYR72_gp010 [Cnaphalocrocis medinalis granulovirus]|uniref:Uncharacterized protein n=1 Tax=Cnaphalocrocis medinalis granulovirus TaxID=1750712 RepID=A0ACD3YJ45_9BBAC|nr:hypothetical protein AYR72_gp010 [Cnaphalocrocis medinalis granulovirus]UNZ38132.1 hypothetical protein [Cnaphalocrocis medinalis granulovirus]